MRSRTAPAQCASTSGTPRCSGALAVRPPPPVSPRSATPADPTTAGFVARSCGTIDLGAAQNQGRQTWADRPCSDALPLFTCSYVAPVSSFTSLGAFVPASGPTTRTVTKPAGAPVRERRFWEDGHAYRLMEYASATTFTEDSVWQLGTWAGGDCPACLPCADCRDGFFLADGCFGDQYGVRHDGSALTALFPAPETGIDQSEERLCRVCRTTCPADGWIGDSCSSPIADHSDRTCYEFAPCPAGQVQVDGGLVADPAVTVRIRKRANAIRQPYLHSDLYPHRTADTERIFRSSTDDCTADTPPPADLRWEGDSWDDYEGCSWASARPTGPLAGSAVRLPAVMQQVLGRDTLAVANAGCVQCLTRCPAGFYPKGECGTQQLAQGWRLLATDVRIEGYNMGYGNFT